MVPTGDMAAATGSAVAVGQTCDESFRELKRKSVRSGLTTFGSQGAGVAIQLASMVVLARLLSPADYGVMAMVMAVTAFAGIFRDLGLSTAVIQRQSLTHEQSSTLFWINVGAGAVRTRVALGAAN